MNDFRVFQLDRDLLVVSLLVWGVIIFVEKLINLRSTFLICAHAVTLTQNN